MQETGQSFSQVIKERVGTRKTGADLWNALPQAVPSEDTLDLIDEQVKRRRRQPDAGANVVIHLDTTFAVDLLREARRQQPGAATAMRSRLETEPLRISVHVACELLAGAALSRQRTAERQRVLRFCDAVDIAYPDARFAPAYGRLLALLQPTGQTVGTMDLLIATSAILDDAPLVTRNRREFSRIPDLEVVGY